MSAKAEQSSIDTGELAKFSAMAAEWWDPTGKFRPLHKFNPVRLSFLRDHICHHFGRDAAALHPFGGLSLLDMGCGGGLLSEPMARLGAEVTGADALQINIQVASAHAQEQGLPIRYLETTAEALAESGESFDVVMAMEIVEHVADVGDFLRTCTKLVKPGGMMFVATLNRTLKAYALAVVGAEYIMRWLPPGTHDWEKFVRPDEIRNALTPQGLDVEGPFGVSYNPITGHWSRSGDSAVNYMMLARKP
ncbi:MAG: bifunctional 2-polyprenyl-6-hydroxyphenol methylase/3-demethylubiquinol 3-O-methyltransferase UbiG [Alphaproteobacteria bacterium]|nr:MAG: bifunctional 2-polyprenyl-6-hydroxyphenol methylase/3-demethylubiquinol 3-O-methyltransferase UbiG [Alphaproteobacteria bacterium]